jgi:hypothetical protein
MPPQTAFSTHQWYDLRRELRRRTSMGGMRNGDMTWIEHGKWWFIIIIFHNGEFWEIMIDNS